jgi:uncharacterized protein YqgQ
MSEQKTQEQKPLGKLPREGEHIYVTIRSRCVKVGKEMVQLELEELFHNNIVKEPVFMWAPTGLITKQQMTVDNVKHATTPKA